MRPLLLLLTLAALLLGGCSADDCSRAYGCRDGIEPSDAYEPDHLTATLTVDPELSAAEVEALTVAVDAWAEATEGRAAVRLVIAAPGQPLPERFVVRRARAGELAANERAAYWRDALTLAPSLESGGYMTPSLVHELGHFFGLGHEDDPADIMYARTHTGMAAAPTADALADLAAIYEWP